MRRTKELGIAFLGIILLTIVVAMTSFPVAQATTRTFSSLEEDGYMWWTSGVGGDYLTAWNHTSGLSSEHSTIYVGQSLGGTTYYVYRGFLFFDTHLVPSAANISSATLSLYLSVNYSDKEFNVSVTNGQPTYPHEPLDLGDYNKAHYSGVGGTRNSSTLTSGYWNITLNSTGCGWIQKGTSAVTKLALRSSKDIAATAPESGFDEKVSFEGYEGGEAKAPKLYVTYTTTGYGYNLHGAYNENGFRNGAINVTYQNFVNSSQTFEVDGDYLIETEVVGGVLRFNITGNLTRTYYLASDTEDVYIFKPEGYVVYYYFDVQDLLGITNGYLESMINVNGTNRVVERWPISHGVIPFLFNVGRSYKMRVVCDEGSYIYGDYPAISISQSYTLVVTDVQFPSSIITTYKYIHIYAYREFGDPTGNITAVYEDLLNGTDSVAMTIKYMNGTLVASYTVEDDSVFSYTFLSAANNTDYIFDATINHYQVGQMKWRQTLLHEFATSPNPFSLDFLGNAPIVTAYIIPIFIVVFVGGLFSVVNRELGAFVAMCIAIFLSAMGWLPIPAGAIVAGLSLVLMVALLRGKKGAVVVE